jgi:hypothetical protein
MEVYSMGEDSEECILAFLQQQGRLYDEPVAETYEEAEEFLEDCMAVVVHSVKEVRGYMESAGVDVDGMTDDDLLEAQEVFTVGDGSYLILEV